MKIVIWNVIVIVNICKFYIWKFLRLIRGIFMLWVEGYIFLYFLLVKILILIKWI